MTKSPLKVAVTGGAGNISYSLLFHLANGETFGKDQPIILQIGEIPPALQALEGVKMELLDCAFPLLKGICISAEPKKYFEGADYAILVGAKPRSQGMERADLLKENGKIFVEQGKALNEVASPKTKVFVIGNPCNTNCWITMHHAPRIPRTHFHAMTRLDHNRGVAFLANKAGVSVEQLKKFTIWGNHSTTMVPDFTHATVDGKPLESVIKDEKWLKETFCTKVQNRGAEVIAARGKSSAGSAAHAIVGAIQSLTTPTPEGEWYSSAVCSDGNPYGVQDDLIFSFPCRTTASGEVKIIKGLELNEYELEKIGKSERELISEKELVLKGL